MINKIKKVFKILCVFTISLCLSSCNTTLDYKKQDAINYINDYANEIRLYEDIILDSNEFDVYIQHNINKLTNSQTKASIDYIIEKFNNDINNYLVCSLETALILKKGYVEYSFKEFSEVLDINDLEVHKFIGIYDGNSMYIVREKHSNYGGRYILIAYYEFYLINRYNIALIINGKDYYDFIDAYFNGILSDETALKLIYEYEKFLQEEGKYK